MDWQQAASLVVVALAGALLGRILIRRRGKAAAWCSICSCGTARGNAPGEPMRPTAAHGVRHH